MFKVISKRSCDNHLEVNSLGGIWKEVQRNEISCTALQRAPETPDYLISSPTTFLQFFSCEIYMDVVHAKECVIKKD